MGLGATLSNALAGMNASQRGIDVLSRNVANAGTPGYHRQSLVITETAYGTSAQVRSAGLTRAFNEALQKQHLIAVSQTGYHSVRANFLDRFQTALGMPGDPNSLDTLYGKFENALQAMATSPNDLTTRAQVLNSAQALVEQLNSLTGSVQEMRRESEYQISNAVSELNRQLTSLADINIRILDLSQDETARLSLLDERDRLVSAIAENIDVRVTYRADGTVAMMTESGVGVLDVLPSQLEFKSGGGLSPASLHSSNPDESGVGMLAMVTPSGLKLDLGSGLLSSGRIAGLLELRDKTLVNAQDQLDEIAAGLALAMNSVTTFAEDDAGSFALNLDGILPGNTVSLRYTDGSGTHTVRLVHTEDLTVPASPNAKGERVIGVDLSDPAIAAAVLGGQFPGLGFTEENGQLVVTTGAATVQSFSSQLTVSGNQNGQAALNLFVDIRDTPFSNSLDGDGQKLGFAGRIQINQDLIANPDLLVKFSPGTSLGDPTRAQFLLDNLKSMEFVSEKMTALSDGGVRLAGKVGDLISQMINHQGNTVSKAQSQSTTVAFTLESIHTRMQAEYGVNVDEEMARLMQLQNAYSASARVVSTVQELIDSLLRI